MTTTTPGVVQLVIWADKSREKVEAAFALYLDLARALSDGEDNGLAVRRARYAALEAMENHELIVNAQRRALRNL